MTKFSFAAWSCGLILLSLSACSSLPETDPAAANLPPHTIAITELPNGKSIEVTSSDSALDRPSCKTLADYYAPYAAPAGLVAVRKPNPDPPWNGKVLPFCTDNMDGKGVSFNDSFFKP